jgi:hypothetical protein
LLGAAASCAAGTRQLKAETAQWIDMAAYREDLIRQGLPEEEARRKTRIDLGKYPGFRIVSVPPLCAG